MMGRLSHDQEQFFYSFRLDEAVPEEFIENRNLYMSGGQDAHHDWLYPHRSRAAVSRLRA